jgi:hypothetical protein
VCVCVDVRVAVRVAWPHVVFFNGLIIEREALARGKLKLRF